MELPSQTFVRPRCFDPVTGDVVLLEEVIGEFLDYCDRGSIEICGERGAGKTMAVSYLMGALTPRVQVRYLDRPDPAHVKSLAAVAIVIFAAPPKSKDKQGELILQLAPWGDDELIEYLLAAHPVACGSVMARVLRAKDHFLVGGNPELWRLVLDQMAADVSSHTVRQALRRSLADELADRKVRRRAGRFALALALNDRELIAKQSARFGGAGGSERLRRLLFHSPIQRLLGAEQLCKDVNSWRIHRVLARRLPRQLIEDAAGQISKRLPLLAELHTLADNQDARLCQPMAASLLHACKQDWRPTPQSQPNLIGAFLQGISWPKVDLAKANLERADCRGADLSGACLDDATAKYAQFDKGKLQQASLVGTNGTSADFSDCDLTDADATSACFQKARLDRSKLERVKLTYANLTYARLTAANLRGADMHMADLRHAVIDDADFSNAGFVEAKLSGLPLRLAASLAGAQFTRADLKRTDLENVHLPDAEFAAAQLAGAHLTGSRMPRANFQSAVLRNTGLADIHWERADLRNADLRGCTFHMGSSRSGLVNSPLASEGTRTGFYTDDYEEQHFKAPEEIRKANLRGADLRGANIEGVDFYLVDLRNANYSPAQAEQFRHCRAIL